MPAKQQTLVVVETSKIGRLGGLPSLGSFLKTSTKQILSLRMMSSQKIVTRAFSKGTFDEYECVRSSLGTTLCVGTFQGWCLEWARKLEFSCWRCLA